jgi:hypothetical protein
MLFLLFICLSRALGSSILSDDTDYSEFPDTHHRRCCRRFMPSLSHLFGIRLARRSVKRIDLVETSELDLVTEPLVTGRPREAELIYNRMRSKIRLAVADMRLIDANIEGYDLGYAQRLLDNVITNLTDSIDLYENREIKLANNFSALASYDLLLQSKAWLEDYGVSRMRAGLLSWGRFSLAIVHNLTIVSKKLLELENSVKPLWKKFMFCNRI